MEKFKRIYNRPRINWNLGKPKCFCNECGKEICGVNFDPSRGEFSTIFYQNLPMICRECEIKNPPLVNPLISLD